MIKISSKDQSYRFLEAWDSLPQGTNITLCNWYGSVMIIFSLLLFAGAVASIVFITLIVQPIAGIILWALGEYVSVWMEATIIAWAAAAICATVSLISFIVIHRITSDNIVAEVYRGFSDRYCPVIEIHHDA